MDISAAIYFEIVFCPDFDHGTVHFYEELFNHFSLETIIKSLARILLVSNENNLSQHYIIAKVLFDELSSKVKFHYRDIAVLTTQASQLEQYQDLNRNQKTQRVYNGKVK